MKKIEFTKNVSFKSKKKEKKERKSIIHVNEKYFTLSLQQQMINQLYLDDDFIYRLEMERELSKKLSSYKQQDISKNKYNPELFISLPEMIEKLVISKLECYYCKHNMSIFYKDVRDNYQWTLDRIDNYQGHFTDNVVICCLECNLKRRRTNADAFLFTKQLKIKKLNN